MKKFCSKCGNQLDLGKKSCTSCQAFNPYFIAGFSSTEDDTTEKTIQTVTTTATGQHSEQKENAAELEFLRNEQLQQKKADLELKIQLIKVKEETEQFKKETFDLVKDVQKELQDIEKENKLLKEKVELLKSQPPVEQKEPVAIASPVIERKVESKKGVTAIAAVALLIVVTIASYSFFRTTTKKTTADTTTNTPTATAPLTVAEDANKSDASKNVTKDSTAKTKLLAVLNTSVTPKIAVTTPTSSVINTPAAIATTPQPAKFSLTQTRLKEDLVGKKLSGCDITIKSLSEINSVENLVLVDKLSASYLKYKCRVKVNQGGEVFTSTPYIYYSAEGTFIKVDGTNCE